jgi:flagellar biosynthesis protein
MNKIDKNNKNKAVALKYSKEDISPKVIAKGQGIVAKNILNKAINEDITIYEDRDLVDKLIQLDIDEEIPEELYEAVAEIIFYVYSLDLKRKDKHE